MLTKHTNETTRIPTFESLVPFAYLGRKWILEALLALRYLSLLRWLNGRQISAVALLL